MRPWICPYCNVRHGPADDTVVGEARVTPDGRLYVRGQLVALPNQERLCLMALVRTPGAKVTSSALASVCGTRATNERMLVCQVTWQLNRLLDGAAEVWPWGLAWSIHPPGEVQRPRRRGRLSQRR